jgi:protein gp37
MGETTGISWTDHTFNPWHGCWKIAPECKNCYAETTANRYTPGLWGRTSPRKFMGEKYWAQLARWNRNAERDGVRRRVFIASMADWAELHPVPAIAEQIFAARARMWREIRMCTWLDFLMLTKRITDVEEHQMLPWQSPHMFGFDDSETRPWPNVWLGVTAGTTEQMIKSVPVLRGLPAAVRFISCEPILEDIPDRVLDDAMRDGATFDGDRLTSCLGPIDWLIIGDESGPGQRPADVAWVERAVAAGKRHGVAVHLKQWAGKVVPPQITDPTGTPAALRKGRKIHLPVLNGVQYAEFPR